MKKFQLNAQDKKILTFLRNDSKMSYKVIAQNTGVAISTVHNTIKRLVELGVIRKFSVKLDSKKIGYGMTVIIDTFANRDTIKVVEQGILQHPNVCQVYSVTGQYDLIMIAKFRNSDELNTFLRDYLQKDLGVERTNTRLVLNTFKEGLNPEFE
jgi:DNA-binding Lrp family transcriptional regulator